jgi:hypothetical protein
MVVVRSHRKSLAPSGEEQYHSLMTTEEVKALPVHRKIQIMEAIWEDLR